jgi:hypothetical protein
MGNAQNQSTNRPSCLDVIASSIASVCSDGNSDARLVARDVLVNLERYGYRLSIRSAGPVHYDMSGCTKSYDPPVRRMPQACLDREWRPPAR